MKKLSHFKMTSSQEGNGKNSSLWHRDPLSKAEGQAGLVLADLPAQAAVASRAPDPGASGARVRTGCLLRLLCRLDMGRDWTQV